MVALLPLLAEILGGGAPGQTPTVPAMPPKATPAVQPAVTAPQPMPDPAASGDLVRSLSKAFAAPNMSQAQPQASPIETGSIVPRAPAPQMPPMSAPPASQGGFDMGGVDLKGMLRNALVGAASADSSAPPLRAALSGAANAVNADEQYKRRKKSDAAAETEAEWKADDRQF